MKAKKAAAIGQLKLTLKKLQIIKSQINNVHNKWKHLDKNN